MIDLFSQNVNEVISVLQQVFKKVNGQEKKGNPKNAKHSDYAIVGIITQHLCWLVGFTNTKPSRLINLDAFRRSQFLRLLWKAPAEILLSIKIGIG